MHQAQASRQQRHPYWYPPRKCVAGDSTRKQSLATCRRGDARRFDIIHLLSWRCWRRMFRGPYRETVNRQGFGERWNAGNVCAQLQGWRPSVTALVWRPELKLSGLDSASGLGQIFSAFVSRVLDLNTSLFCCCDQPCQHRLEDARSSFASTRRLRQTMEQSFDHHVLSPMPGQGRIEEAEFPSTSHLAGVSSYRDKVKRSWRP